MRFLLTTLALFVGAAAIVPAQETRPRIPELQQTVTQIDKLVSMRRYADAWKQGAGVRAELEAPGVPADLAARGRQLILAAGLETVGAAAGFKGDANPLDKGLVEVVYDAKAPGWERDFELVELLPTAKKASRKGRILDGTGALCHTAMWADPVTVEITGRPSIPTDFGPVFVDPDETETERFLTAFLNNQYFGIKYDADRTVTQGHVLLLAGRGAVSRAKVRPTQLLGRTALPAVAHGNDVVSSLSIAGTKVDSLIRTSPTSVGSMSFLLEAAQVFPRIRPGILVRDSELEIGRIVLRGRLDPAWSRDATARLRESLKPPSAAR
jgi:hypothetical protein